MIALISRLSSVSSLWKRLPFFHAQVLWVIPRSSFFSHWKSLMLDAGVRVCFVPFQGSYPPIQLFEIIFANI